MLICFHLQPCKYRSGAINPTPIDQNEDRKGRSERGKLRVRKWREGKE